MKTTFAWVLCGTIENGSFQSHHKNKSLGRSPSWSSFAFIFLSLLSFLLDENNIHLVDFHETHLIDIWLFQNRIPAIVDPLIIRPELRFDKTNASESTLQAWPWLPFRMFSPEYFCPNQRFAQKSSEISVTGGAAAFSTLPVRTQRTSEGFARIHLPGAWNSHKPIQRYNIFPPE